MMATTREAERRGRRGEEGERREAGREAGEAGRGRGRSEGKGRGKKRFALSRCFWALGLLWLRRAKLPYPRALVLFAFIYFIYFIEQILWSVGYCSTIKSINSDIHKTINSELIVFLRLHLR